MATKKSVRESFGSLENFSFTLKDAQEEIIAAILNERSVTAVLPTGYGKSMCYIVHHC